MVAASGFRESEVRGWPAASEVASAVRRRPCGLRGAGSAPRAQRCWERMVLASSYGSLALRGLKRPFPGFIHVPWGMGGEGVESEGADLGVRAGGSSEPGRKEPFGAGCVRARGADGWARGPRVRRSLENEYAEALRAGGAEDSGSLRRRSFVRPGATRAPGDFAPTAHGVRGATSSSEPIGAAALRSQGAGALTGLSEPGSRVVVSGALGSSMLRLSGAALPARVGFLGAEVSGPRCRSPSGFWCRGSRAEVQVGSLSGRGRFALHGAMVCRVAAGTVRRGLFRAHGSRDWERVVRAWLERQVGKARELEQVRGLGDETARILVVKTLEAWRVGERLRSRGRRPARGTS